MNIRSVYPPEITRSRKSDGIRWIGLPASGSTQNQDRGSFEQQVRKNGCVVYAVTTLVIMPVEADRSIQKIMPILSALPELVHAAGGRIESVKPRNDTLASGRGGARVWRVNDSFSVLVKEADPDDPSLKKEHAAYLALEDAPGVPTCYGFDRGVLALEYIDGASPVDFRRLTPARVHRLEKFLTHLRTIEPGASGTLDSPVIERGCPKGPRAFVESDAARRYAGDHAALAERFVEASRSVDGDFAVHRVHGDFYPANILAAGPELYFIDLEMSSVSDPVTDIARFYRELFQFVFEHDDPAAAARVSGDLLGIVARVEGETALDRLPFWIAVRMLNGGSHFERVRRNLDEALRVPDSIVADPSIARQSVGGIGQFIASDPILELLQSDVARGDIGTRLTCELERCRDRAETIASLNVRVVEALLEHGAIDASLMDRTAEISAEIAEPESRVTGSGMRSDSDIEFEVGTGPRLHIGFAGGDARSIASERVAHRISLTTSQARPISVVADGVTDLMLPTREGESISYPADSLHTDRPYLLTTGGTASDEAIVMNRGDFGMIFAAENSPGTPVRLAVEAYGNRTEVTFFHTGPAFGAHYLAYPFRGPWQAAVSRFRRLRDAGPARQIHTRPARPESANTGGAPAKVDLDQRFRLLFKIGVVAPRGTSAIANYAALVPICRTLVERFGAGHIVHLYGWHAAGHDHRYPEYEASPSLGGAKALAEAISEIRDLGLEVSLYLNARIADAEVVAGCPDLKAAAMRDPAGKLVLEAYNAIESVVMNPSADAWRKAIAHSAARCVELGASLIELDQIGYQRAIGPDWIAGNQGLIDAVRTACPDTKLWIEGVSACYRGIDFFQANGRNKIFAEWESGENRSGTLGEYLPELWPVLHPELRFSMSVNDAQEVEEARTIGAVIGDIPGGVLGYADDGIFERIDALAGKIKMGAGV